MEVGNFTEVKAEAVTEALLQLAKDTEDLACKERESFSPILKRWHTTAAGIAAVTLHNCYGAVLKQYLNGVSTLTADTVEILQRAAKLEKVLLQMVVEDSAECEDGGKAIVREMVPYEVDTIIVNLLKKWIYERMKKGKECVNRAKESEVNVDKIYVFLELMHLNWSLSSEYTLFCRHGIQSLNRSHMHNQLRS